MRRGGVIKCFVILSRIFQYSSQIGAFIANEDVKVLDLAKASRSVQKMCFTNRGTFKLALGSATINDKFS